jgi:hypothetical protein
MAGKLPKGSGPPRQDIDSPMIRVTRKRDEARWILNLSNWLAMLWFMGFIAGCSGYAFKAELPSNYVVEANLSKGVVVGSVGSKAYPETKYREQNMYLFRSISNPDLRGYVSSATAKKQMFTHLGVCSDDGLPDECGSLFAIALPVGEYEFFSVIPALNSRANGDSFVFDSPWNAPLQGYRFSVHSGKVAYLGNMLSRICTGSSQTYWALFSTSVARSAVGDIADMYDRDVPLLIEKYPQLNTTIINNETIAGAPWRWEYQQLNDQILIVERPDECLPERDE